MSPLKAPEAHQACAEASNRKYAQNGHAKKIPHSRKPEKQPVRRFHAPKTHSRQTRSQQTLPNADPMSGHLPSLPVMPNSAPGRRRGDKVGRGLNNGHAGLILESEFSRYGTNAPLALRQASRPPWI